MTNPEFAALLVRNKILLRYESRVRMALSDYAAAELREWMAVERQAVLAEFLTLQCQACDCPTCTAIRKTVTKWKGETT